MEISQCENEVAQTESIFCPLDAEVKEIRLVRLDFDRGDDIHMSMKHVRLIDNPDFIALSYVWGDAIPTYPVHINYDGFNGDVHIRENLHDFLAQIQQERDDQWYWIDQICINQADAEEKSHQVFQMADVFSQARQVTGWLGTGFGGEDKLRRFFSPETFSRCEFMYSSSNQITPLHESKETFIKQKPIFEQFMELPYWSRTWTRQEIGLASIFEARLGSTAVFARDLSNIFYFFHEMLWLGGKYSYLAFRLYPLCVLLNRVGAVPKKTLAWDDIWAISHGTACADVRDCAYAGLGLLPSELRIKPNYTVDSTAMTVVFDIVRGTTRAILHHSATDNETRKSGSSTAAATNATNATNAILDNLSELVELLRLFMRWKKLLMSRDRAAFDDTSKVVEFLRSEILAPMRHRRKVAGSRIRLPYRVEYILIKAILSRNIFIEDRVFKALTTSR